MFICFISLERFDREDHSGLEAHDLALALIAVYYVFKCADSSWR